MPDFVEAAKQAVKLKDKFVLLSQRWDYDITTPLDFTEGWEIESTVHLSENRTSFIVPQEAIFSSFPKSCYTDIPHFTIGRAGWDNWMIYKARQEKWPVIDCTPSVMIVHQNHDYSHLPGGQVALRPPRHN